MKQVNQSVTLTTTMLTARDLSAPRGKVTAKPRRTYSENQGYTKRGDKRNKPVRGVKECQLWQSLEV